LNSAIQSASRILKRIEVRLDDKSAPDSVSDLKTTAETLTLASDFLLRLFNK